MLSRHANRATRIACGAAAVLWISGLAACAGDTVSPGADANVRSIEASLLGGHASNTTIDDVYGLVQVAGRAGTCSGVALDSRTVITAAHCGLVLGVSFLGTTYFLRAQNGEFIHPDWHEENDVGSDYQILFLSSELRDRDGNEWKRQRGLWDGSGEDAEGEPLWCFGASTGTYRYGPFEATEYIPDSSAQTPGGLVIEGDGARTRQGDSGGPCFSRRRPFGLVGLISYELFFVQELIAPLDGPIRNWIFATWAQYH